MEGWLSLIRNVLLFAGGWITSSGVMSSTEWEAVVGALLVIVAAVWKIIVNRKRRASK